jgi:hypothetical protein
MTPSGERSLLLAYIISLVSSHEIFVATLSAVATAGHKVLPRQVKTGSR